MSGIRWQDMWALEALIREWLTKPRRKQGAPGVRKAPAGRSLWLWFWRHCMPAHTSVAPRGEA
jgi:hypothetical protein